MKRSWCDWRRLALWTLVFVSWAAMQTTAWRQPGRSEEEPPQYVLPYALVVFGIVLGLVVLFNPTRRREKAKIDPLDEKKPKKSEKG